jgi:hypothetical protein
MAIMAFGLRRDGDVLVCVAEEYGVLCTHVAGMGEDDRNRGVEEVEIVKEDGAVCVCIPC